MLTIEAGLIILGLVALMVESISFFINNYYLNPPSSREERRLEKRAAKLQGEAKRLEGSPATFVEFSKVGREASQCELRVNKLKAERESRKNTKAGKLAARVQSFLLPIPIVFSYVLWTYFVSEIHPVAAIPEPGWVWPMAHILALPNQPANGSISSIGWMILCRRVFARFINLAFGA